MPPFFLKPFFSKPGPPRPILSGAVFIYLGLILLVAVARGGSLAAADSAGSGGRPVEIMAEHRLTAATVYVRQASLIRKASVEVPAGASVVVLAGLPATVLTESLRVAGQGAAPVTFSALRHRLETGTALTAERERALSRQLEEVQDQRQRVMVQRQALAARQQFLERLGQQAETRIGQEFAELRLTPEAWPVAAAVIGDALADILTADLDHQITLRDLERRQKQLEAELAGWQTGQRQSLRVMLPLTAAAATRLDVTLHYQVPGVSWEPVYDVRLDTATDELTLVQYGAVRQQTGEDWEDIRLVLSTAQPQRGAALPVLTPHWVDLVDPARHVSGGKSSARLASREMMADTDGVMPAPAPQEAQFTEATLRETGLVTEYDIAGPVSVPADGSVIQVRCGTFSTTSRRHLQVTPHLSRQALWVSRMELQGETPLLAGTASLFRDGAYIGRLQLPLLPPGQPHDIGFGIEDRLVVTRRILTDTRRDTTLLSRDRHQERHTVTILKNRLPRPIHVAVLETIPTPRHERLRVEIQKSATTAGYDTDHNDIKGLLHWKLELAPGEEARIKLGWKVSWPGDVEVRGL